MNPVLWLANPALVDGAGHHLGYNNILVRAARDMGWESRVFAGTTFSEPLEVAVDRIFRTDWRRSPPWFVARWPRGLEVVEELARRRFRADLQRLPAPGRNSIIFAQMIAPRHLCEWIGWFRASGASGALVLHLGYDPHRFGAVREIAERAGKRVFFVSDSALLARSYESILGVPVAVLNHVVEMAIGRPGEAGRSGPVRFVSLGNARREKGFCDLVEAVRASFRDAEFVLQANRPDSVCREKILSTQLGDHVTLLRNDLSEGEYRRVLLSADVVTVPYHLDCYRERTSGVFCEALVAGKPVIATEGSWMAGELERWGAGWLVPERAPDDLARVMARACGEVDRMSVLARGRAEENRTRFSPGRFLSDLRELVANGG